MKKEKKDETQEESSEREEPKASEEVKEETVKPVPEVVEEPELDEEPVFEESAAGADETVKEEVLEDRSRTKWLAAMAYLPLICLIPLFMNRDDEFIQKHAKQGFILFLIEIVAMLLTINQIWILIIIICLATAVVGAVGILIRGEIRIPILADFADRLKF